MVSPKQVICDVYSKCFICPIDAACTGTEEIDVCKLHTHHIHDLHETKTKVNSEGVRVVVHGPLQWVIVSHQVLI